jgi:hypothetical protein
MDRQVDYKTQGTLKECHKAAWQGRGTKPWTIEVTAVALGEDCTMGDQNKRPAIRKDPSSMLCTQWDRMPN